MQKNDIKILIVDDSKTIQKAISNVLINECGILQDNLFYAENGFVGINVFKDVAPDLILSDWHMPVIDGLAFVDEIRKINSMSIIVMVTTEGAKSKVIEAFKHGVNDFITKPFTPEVARKKLDVVINMALRRKIGSNIDLG